ncbi:hypothetical protein [Streptomyces marincola]|uniref:Uncharacterized protein n=1 Tax=Streptomyces marincola TaxID=2878388 RepID=A0A1W7D4K2_9ACTN|nr:hypothetical protein [Streptomyces marincola]ARQ71942.1 hypothetical protein CAG99_26705 [Streptomyces marincola]
MPPAAGLVTVTAPPGARASDQQRYGAWMIRLGDYRLVAAENEPGKSSRDRPERAVLTGSP